MTKKLFFIVVAMMLATLACSVVSIGNNTVIGSGKVASQTRSESGFSLVVLKGSPM